MINVDTNMCHCHISPLTSDLNSQTQNSVRSKPTRIFHNCLISPRDYAYASKMYHSMLHIVLNSYTDEACNYFIEIVLQFNVQHTKTLKD
jgi:hypothetical protein